MRRLGYACVRMPQNTVRGLTIHSSRNRFAVRLNSGVRPRYGVSVKLVAVILAIVFVLGANVWALRSSGGRHTPLHNAARLSGRLGLLSALVFFIALADAITQIWVKRPGYEGWPVIISLCLVLLVSISSLVLSAIVAKRARAIGA